MPNDSSNYPIVGNQVRNEGADGNLKQGGIFRSILDKSSRLDEAVQ
jgi:hypothetical protein